LALNLLDLPFECLDSLVCLIGELLGRLQKQLAQLERKKNFTLPPSKLMLRLTGS
jgi:hypothetical protein